MRMIAGLEEITAGEIRIGPKRVNELPPKERDIAMVFQNYALYPHMTVGKNMAFSLMLAKQDQATITSKVGRAAEILALTPLLDRYPRPLSGALFGGAPPARREGPRDRARPAGLPFRRAAVQPRCEAARRDAQRDQG